MRYAFIPALALVLITGAAFAEKPKTIVGLWSAPEGGCSMDEGATRIGPKSLQNADVFCKFRTVRRKGATVIWKGPCDDVEGSTEQTVTATEKNGKLTLSYAPGGNVIEGLKRCK
jgi:hypothetical protein